MNSKTILVCVLALSLSTGLSGKDKEVALKMKNVEWVDKSRNRNIPVEIYSSTDKAYRSMKRHPVAIINHGYGAPNTAYSFIAGYLVSKGYVVASIQHDQPDDPPMASSGYRYEQRKPVWERGVQNMLYVIGMLKQHDPWLGFDSLLVIGHSNGGDMAMLLATEHPDAAARIISLDSRRMPFPRASRPKILSIRGTDFEADPGVLPDAAAQKQYGIHIVKVNGLHADFCDIGKESAKEEAIIVIDKFLNGQL
jgi:predicted dienelactone hydrolase